MPRRTLTISEEERKYLEQTRDRDPRPYLRERAAALLKVADGQVAHDVALRGLHKPREPDTIYAWLDDFQKTRRLKVRPACRRTFSPGGPRTPASP